MADIYPQSMLCRFEGFPGRLRVTCGRAFAAMRVSPYAFGSRVVLTQTPVSGVMQGVLVSGQPLPDCAMVYSDSGSDEIFDLKLSHYGYGRFYLPTSGASCYSLSIVKGLRVEAAGIRRSFETVDVWETLIPASADLGAVASVGSVIVQDADGAGVLWFVGDVPAGGTVVAGRLQLGGDVGLRIGGA